jgi:hypothetical protein
VRTMQVRVSGCKGFVNSLREFPFRKWQQQ